MNLRSALAFSFGTRYAATAVNFFSTLILARLLTPTEIGIYSVGASVIMIAHTLRDFGMSNYIIQETDLTRDRIRTAFTLTLAVAWTLGLAIYLAAKPISEFYNEPAVALVMQVMAINFAIIPMGSIGGAILRREMRFKALMYIGVASTLVTSISAVLFVYLGFGFISLAWSAVLGTITSVLGNLVAERKTFLLRPSLLERQRVLSFSVTSSISSIAYELGHTAPDIILGRTIGMNGAGLFSRAFGYVQLFERLLQDALQGVMLPYLSEQFRSGIALRAKLQSAAPHIASISFFVIGLTATLAEPAFAVLFGPQWKEAVPTAQLLCIAMALRCLSPTLTAAMIASGRMSLVMRVTIAATSAKFLLLVALSNYGLIYAALGFVGAELLGLGILLYRCQIANIFTLTDYFRVSLRALPPAVTSCVFAWATSAHIPLETDFVSQALRLVFCGTISTALWLTLIWLFNIEPKSELKRLFRRLIH